MENKMTSPNRKFNNRILPTENSNINDLRAVAHTDDGVFVDQDNVVVNSHLYQLKTAEVMQTSPLVKRESGKTILKDHLPKMIETDENTDKTEDCNADGSIAKTTDPPLDITSVQNKSETLHSLGQSVSHHCPDAKMKIETVHHRTETFNNKDMLRLRIHLLEITEEIKIRRLSDKENEERMKKLMTENHELNLKYENALEEVHKINDSKESSLTAMKKEHQNKISNMELVQHKLQVTVDNYMKECKHLKDELQCIQMAKYDVEKEMKEQERRLKLRDSVRDTGMTQLAVLEKVCKDVVRKMEELKENHSRLEKNVKEACKLNNKMNYLIDHHTCEINWYKSQITVLQNSLTKANVALEKRPHAADQQLKETEQINKKLEQKLKLAEESVQRMETYLEQNKEELATMESQMKTSNDLVLRHVKQLSQKTEEIHNLQTSLVELTESNAKLKVLYDEKSKELEEERSGHMDKQHQWTKQKELMEHKLSQLQKDHQLLLRAHNNLEELNTKWAVKNTALSQEINALKEHLIKCKSDKEVQTNMDTGVGAIQTEILHSSSVCLQTEVIEMSSISIQTEINDKMVSVNSANLRCSDVKQNSALCQTNVEHTNSVNMSICENVKDTQQSQQQNKIADSQTQPVCKATEISSVQVKETSSPQNSQENEAMNSYNTFSRTLKTIASMFTAVHPGKPEDKDDDKDKCTLKRKISESQLSVVSRNEPNNNNSQNTVPTMLCLTKEKSRLSGEGCQTGVKNLSSILLDPSRACKRHKRVSFCDHLEYHSMPATDAAISHSANGEETLLTEDESKHPAVLENQIEELTEYLNAD